MTHPPLSESATSGLLSDEIQHQQGLGSLSSSCAAQEWRSGGGDSWSERDLPQDHWPAEIVGCYQCYLCWYCYLYC